MFIFSVRAHVSALHLHQNVLQADRTDRTRPHVDTPDVIFHKDTQSTFQQQQQQQQKHCGGITVAVEPRIPVGYKLAPSETQGRLLQTCFYLFVGNPCLLPGRGLLVMIGGLLWCEGQWCCVG